MLPWNPLMKIYILYEACHLYLPVSARLWQCFTQRVIADIGLVAVTLKKLVTSLQLAIPRLCNLY